MCLNERGYSGACIGNNAIMPELPRVPDAPEAPQFISRYTSELTLGCDPNYNGGSDIYMYTFTYYMERSDNRKTFVIDSRDPEDLQYFRNY